MQFKTIKRIRRMVTTRIKSSERPVSIKASDLLYGIKLNNPTGFLTCWDIPDIASTRGFNLHVNKSGDDTFSFSPFSYRKVLRNLSKANANNGAYVNHYIASYDIKWQYIDYLRFEGFYSEFGRGGGFRGQLYINNVFIKQVETIWNNWDSVSHANMMSFMFDITGHYVPVPQTRLVVEIRNIQYFGVLKYINASTNLTIKLDDINDTSHVVPLSTELFILEN